MTASLTPMAILSVVFGILLLGLGFFTLPAPPASSGEVVASGAPLALFFGGPFIICGIFIHKYEKHGKIGVALLGLIALFFSLYTIVPAASQGEDIHAPLINGLLLIMSLIITGLSLTHWRKSRGIKVQ